MPGAGGFEAGGFQEGFYCGWGEFVTVFGVDGFAGSEVEGEGGSAGVFGDVDALGVERLEVHLDAGFGGVPEGDVAEGREVEVGSEVAVEAGEDVAVEGGGDAGGVVVGGEEGGFVFVRAGAEVGAEEEGVAGEELGAEVAEDVAGGRGGEVADAGTDVEGEGAGVGEAVFGEGLAGVVGDLTADGDAGDVGEDVFAGSVEGGLGDVYGLVDDVSLMADGGSEEDAGLGGGACAELDEGEGLPFGAGGGGDDLVGVGGEDAALGAGEVVLGEGGDLLEEMGAGFVVEEPGREGFARGGEAGAGFASDGLGGGVGGRGFVRIS